MLWPFVIPVKQTPRLLSVHRKPIVG